MTLRIEIREKLACPAIYCDHCGKKIAEARNGNYEWEIDITGMPIPERPIYFTHKKCCLAFEEMHGGRRAWYTDELYLLPLFLENNLEINHQEARDQALLSP